MLKNHIFSLWFRIVRRKPVQMYAVAIRINRLFEYTHELVKIIYFDCFFLLVFPFFFRLVFRFVVYIVFKM